MNQHNKTRSMVQIGLMAALISIMAQIVIPIGPVPFSMAVFGVYLTGELVSPKAAAASIGIYLLIGTAGIPVFSGFKAGPQVLLGPTGGYLIGYLMPAILVSLATKQGYGWKIQFLALVTGQFGCYLLGSFWLSKQAKISFSAALASGMLPFIVPDLFKACLAVALGLSIRKRMEMGRTHHESHRN